MIDRSPLPLGSAVKALVSCVVRSGVLLAGRRVHQPAEHVGWHFGFADGTTSQVYRETVVDRPPPGTPVVLVVSFRLRRVRGDRGHAMFRLESVLNTVLFVGFAGLISKLWLRHDQRGIYRGLYEWDDPELAVAYVRALWWALALVSVPGSIHYAVLPGLRRDDVLGDPGVLAAVAPAERGAWWRVTTVDARVA